MSGGQLKKDSSELLKKPQRTYHLHKNPNKDLVRKKESPFENAAVRTLALTGKGAVKTSTSAINMIRKKKGKKPLLKRQGQDDSFLNVNDDSLTSKSYNSAARNSVRTVKSIAELTRIVRERKRTAPKRKQFKQEKKKAKANKKQDKNVSLLKKKEKLKNVVPRNHTFKGLVKSNAVAGLKNFKGSDDLGAETIKKTRDAVVNARRAARAARKTYRAAKWLVKGAAKLTAFIFKALASAISALLPIMPIILVVVVVVAVVLSIIPQITLKSTDVELSKTYSYVTKLDAEFNKKIYEEKNGADVYHFYINGSEINEMYAQIKTNPDSVLAYLDAKYQDYALDKFIYGLFGGTNVKDEVKQIHGQLYSYTVSTYTKETKVGEDENGNEILEESSHKDISIKSQLFDSWLKINKNTLFQNHENGSFDILNEAGVFEAKKEVGSPFPGENFLISKRYGHTYETAGNISVNKGIDIVCEPDRNISAGLKGQVTEVGENYVIIETKKRKLIYSSVLPSVSEGTEVNRGDVIAKSSNTDLHMEYYKNGKELCPYIFVKGASGYSVNKNANSGENIVKTALSQLGQVGGKPYWSWFGYNGRVEWCAIFVSWCAEQCGYVEKDIIFKHASCTTGVSLWKKRGLFQERSSGYIPKPGDLIYFVWTPGDSGSDHVGIVESSDGKNVYTIEGNSGDAVKQNVYSLSSQLIIGYATPLYPSNVGGYSDEDLYWLSRVISAEAGSDWLDDSFMQDVGSVVLNRVKHSKFPNSIKSVIFHQGQYECVTNGSIYKEPTEKAIANAKKILENGSTLPSRVVFQSQFVQGEIHSTYYDSVLDTTTYFCYDY